VTPELQSFIEYFADEEQLRSAIEGLLSKREECLGVRNLHGKDEQGKDLIFYAPAGLGRLRLNACVVKLGKITGSASDSTSRRETSVRTESNQRTLATTKFTTELADVVAPLRILMDLARGHP